MTNASVCKTIEEVNNLASNGVQMAKKLKTAPVCEKCKKVVVSVDVVEIQTCKASWGGPAEYEEQHWCADCISRAEYLSDPFNESYERARANGWAD